MFADVLPEVYTLGMDHVNLFISDYGSILLLKFRHWFHTARNKIRKLQVLKQTEKHYLENPRNVE